MTTKREEAEQAMRLGPKYATEEARVALLREAINEALEEAARGIESAPASYNRNDHADRVRGLKEGP